jgi:hypothetical protein
MGAAAMTRARRLYSVQAMTEATIEVYLSMLAAASARRPD